MASVPLRWLIGQWGEQLYGDDLPVTPERYAMFTSAEFDRRLDDRVFWKVEDILGAVEEVVGYAQEVMVETSIAQARSMFVLRRMTDQWEAMRSVHPDGISKNPETGEMTRMDLVATFRHIQNEFYTHLFNIQRAKIALGIEPIVRLPDAGYHLAADWDSEIPPVGAAQQDIG